MKMTSSWIIYSFLILGPGILCERQLGRRQAVSSCVIPTVKGVVYTYKGSNEIISPGTFIKYNTTVFEKCEVGYVENCNSDYRVCQKNGEWTQGSDKLRLMNCPPLLSDTLDIKCRYNGKNANCSNFSKPNTTATLSCKDEYIATNSKAQFELYDIYCQSNGIWNRQLLSCRPCNKMIPLDILSCTFNYRKLFGTNECVLPTAEGIVYTYKDSNESLPHGTSIDNDLIVNENCEVGYHEAYTNSSRFCQRNGQWLSNSEKLCLKMCLPLLSDSLDIKCTYNGKNANCSNLSKPNTSAKLSCKPTYSAPNVEDTPLEIYCQSDGIWNRQLYTCKPPLIQASLCVLPTVEGIVYTYDDSNDILSHGTLINHTLTVNENCEVGYHKAYPNSFRVCQRNGKWKTVSENLCLKMCPPLISDSLDIKCTLNGKYANCSNPSIPDTIATPSCKTTHKLPNGQDETPLNIHCQSNGKWDNHLYDCEPYCGKNYSNTKLLIANGQNASFGTAPWNVAIYRLNEKSHTLICGGSIIGPNLVVSAAHCFWNETMTSNTIFVNDGLYKIAVGKYARDFTVIDNTFTKIMDVEIVYLKDGYNGNKGHHVEDIAIILLKNRIAFNDGVAPACIDWEGKFNVANEDKGKVSLSCTVGYEWVTVMDGIKFEFNDIILSLYKKNYSDRRVKTIVGWGKTEKGIESPILLEAFLPYFNNRVCRQMFKTGFVSYVTFDKFCAGSTSVSGQRVGGGDSGAGLCFEHSDLYYLTGVASSNDPETTNSIAAFTDIKSHINWIRELHIKHK